MSGDAPAVVAAGGNSTAEEVDLTEGASGTVGAAGPATAAASTPAAVAAAASSTNGDAPTTAEAEPVVVSTEASEKGHKPEAAGENGQAAEVAPASEPPSTASRKRKAGEEVPETPGAEPAEATAVPSPGKTTLLAGLRVEDLAPTVRARMEEVLKEGEDDGMRKDVRLVNFLGEVEEAQALAALNEYHAAVSETSVTIRNKPAYLMGILRKYKQGQRAPLGNGTGGGMATAPNAMGRMGAGPDGLSPSIAKRLEKLYESGFIEKSDVDQRCLVFFRDLTEPEAEAAMDEFGQSDITSIRNKSAFLMSILRRHHQASNTPAGTAAAAVAAGAGGGGGVRPPPNAAASAAAAAAAAAGMGIGMGMGGIGMGMFGAHPFAGAPHMPHPYGFMDPSMGVPAPFADFYGGVYGHAPPPLFNAYGQPMATFIPPHMPMYQPGCSEMLPASIQLRLDQLATTGFCHPGEIDDRCRKFLREVPEHIALQAIEEFMSTDRKSIRKVSAYFMGVIRKHAENYRDFVAAASAPAPSAGPPHPYEAGMKRIREYSDFWAKNPPKAQAGSALMERLAGAPAKVQAGINDLVKKGLAVEWDIDARVSNAFSALTEEQGVEAIEEFASCDMSRIRNKSAYLMGLLKRHKSGAPPPAGLAQR